MSTTRPSSFILPKAIRVRLTVFDSTDRTVATFADDIFGIGEHRMVFDGSALPTGIYFARLQSREFTATQKLLLLK